jgi:hypothetical protein
MKTIEEKAVQASKFARRKESSKQHLEKKLKDERKTHETPSKREKIKFAEEIEDTTEEYTPVLFGFELIDD